MHERAPRVTTPAWLLLALTAIILGLPLASIAQPDASLSITWQDHMTDLGQIGPAVPPSEEDEWEKLMANVKKAPAPTKTEANQAIKTYFSKLEQRPGKPRATQDLTRHIRPGYRIKQSILAPDGHALAQTGDILYPLDHVKMPQRWFIFDGTDRTQQEQAARYWLAHRDLELAVVKGNPLTVTTSMQALFPQLPKATQGIGHQVLNYGRPFRVWLATDPMLDVFAIQAVPSLVTQVGLELTVREIPYGQ